MSRRSYGKQSLMKVCVLIAATYGGWANLKQVIIFVPASCRGLESCHPPYEYSCPFVSLVVALPCSKSIMLHMYVTLSLLDIHLHHAPSGPITMSWSAFTSDLSFTGVRRPPAMGMNFYTPVSWGNSLSQSRCVCPLCPTGTYVTQVTATDADDPTYGNSARVVYSILHGQPYFSVDAKTGEAVRSSWWETTVISWRDLKHQQSRHTSAGWSRAVLWPLCTKQTAGPGKDLCAL